MLMQQELTIIGKMALNSAGWGEVVSKYPDGTPATVQGRYGSGWVVLTGVHPEAPENWRKEFFFTTPIESSHNYAAMLIKAAIKKNSNASFLVFEFTLSER